MTRAERVGRVSRAAADFGAARDRVDEAAAVVFGTNRTDLRIIGLLFGGRLTAGELAGAAGLSPAATSTAIQRLVAAGHLTQRTDDTDRRRAVLTLTDTAVELVDRTYGPLASAGADVLRHYTGAELEVIEDFLDRGRRLQLAQAQRIRALLGAPVPP